jgi:hypothetical protein
VICREGRKRTGAKSELMGEVSTELEPVTLKRARLSDMKRGER